MVTYTISFIYNLINLANITCFATIPFIYNYIPIQYNNYINNYLICYFFIDSFKNYNNASILLHHSMYAFLIYKLNDFTLTNYYLVLDISTIFLLIIKTFKTNLFKPLFIFLWIILRFLYFPIITYYFINNYYKNITNNSNISYNNYNSNDYNINKILIFTASIISNNLHLYWTISLFDNKLKFEYALSSNFLHIIPVGFSLYYNCLTFEKFMISFYMFFFSSLQYVFKNTNYNKLYSIIITSDTTIITYISLMHLNNSNIYYINYLLCIINIIIKLKFKKSKIHMFLVLLSLIKHILKNSYILILLQPGILIFINNLLNNNIFKYQDLFLWHSSVSYAIANTFILN